MSMKYFSSPSQLQSRVKINPTQLEFASIHQAFEASSLIWIGFDIACQLWLFAVGYLANRILPRPYRFGFWSKLGTKFTVISELGSGWVEGLVYMSKNRIKKGQKILCWISRRTGILKWIFASEDKHSWWYLYFLMTSRAKWIRYQFLDWHFSSETDIADKAHHISGMAFSDFCRSLSRKKTVDLTSTKLNKFMGTFDLTAIGVGSSLGLGVYVLAGQVAKTMAGPSVIVSFAIAAFASVLAGFCFAEFGARVPKAGSAYIYSYVTVGEFVAFLVGWNLVLEYAIGSAALAKGISEHFDILIGGKMSEFWKEVIPMDIPYMGRYVDFSAFAIVVVISSMCK